MKKIILIGLIIAIAAGAVGGYFFVQYRKKQALLQAEAEALAASATPVPYKKDLPKSDLKQGTEDYPFEIYVETQLQHREETYDAAVEYAKQYVNASVMYRKSGETVWDNYLAFNVFYGDRQYAEYETFGEAAEFAGSQERAFIFYRRSNEMIWSNADPWPDAYQIREVGVILQNPELPRGCEVTSLTMLLRYYGVKVNKIELAEKVKKDTTEYKVANGKVHAGNPNNGFVGDMTNRNNFGLGVYHGPIYELLRQYKPSGAMDLTGCNFDDLFSLIRTDTPIWIITNTTYKKLPASSFEKWQTPDGEISITYSEHSVLVTGYDENFIYFNDPLSGARSAERNGFIEAWEQMGRQAVAVSE